MDARSRGTSKRKSRHSENSITPSWLESTESKKARRTLGWIAIPDSSSATRTSSNSSLPLREVSIRSNRRLNSFSVSIINVLNSWY